VQIFEISDRIKYLVTIQFDPKPIQLFEIFEYLFKRNIKTDCVSVRKCGCPQHCC